MKTVDLFAKDLHEALTARNLTDIVDIVFVSDHGMADTSHPEWVYIDDYLDKQALDLISHEDGWPSMGLRFSPEANSSAYLNILQDAAKNNSEKFDVYTHETMPERYHFSHNPRIAPIYIVPKYGYALTTRDRGESGMNKGVSPLLPYERSPSRTDYRIPSSEPRIRQQRLPDVRNVRCPWTLLKRCEGTPPPILDAEQEQGLAFYLGRRLRYGWVPERGSV